MADNGSQGKVETIESWSDDLVAAITYRTGITYAINEILKSNTKTVFTVAAVDYLKKLQTEQNAEIKRVLNQLISGTRG